MDCHRNDFNPKPLGSTCTATMAELGPYLRGKGNCRDYDSAACRLSSAMRNKIGSVVHRPEDWFGITAYAKLQVFYPFDWPWNWRYETVWEHTFYSNSWRTGGCSGCSAEISLGGTGGTKTAIAPAHQLCPHAGLFAPNKGDCESACRDTGFPGQYLEGQWGGMNPG